LVAALVGVALFLLALAVRVVVHAGRTPGGVDTWYYLAYADAFRKSPSLDVRLPQYLLQDEQQSYPPVFPSLLAALPAAWLRRRYWLVSPLIDCAHLLLLYVVTLRITDSVAVAAIAAATYAFTPQLVSETRSLSARPFGALLHSVGVLLLLKDVVSGAAWAWTLSAALVAAILFLSSGAMAAAYVFVTAVLSLVSGNPRYLAIAAGGLALAVILSGGHMLRVIANYGHAVAYWRRNRRWFGGHPVHDSPLLGMSPSKPAQRPGFLGRTTVEQVVRLVGENPFLLALPLATHGVAPWGPPLYTWAVALATLAVIATVLPPLRAFGPGRSYMKAAIFPTAYTLAVGIGNPAGLARPLGMATLACLIASLAAIAFFLFYVRSRPSEQTASVPAGLAEVARILRDVPDGAVFVLPYMYADYLAYWSQKPVAWGGHCGNLRKLEWIAPLITRHLDVIFAALGVLHVVLDGRYAGPADLGLEGKLRARWTGDGFTLYEYSARGVGEREDGSIMTP
jgi:hypothetical protein